MRALLSIALAVGFAATAAADDDDRIVLGAVGDSLTAAFNAQHLGDNREHSWSTGNSEIVLSHKRRLELEIGRPVVADNEAISGAVASGLDRQITRLLASEPDFVTMVIGANDVCGWADEHHEQLAQFEYDVRMGLRKLVTARPSAHIILGPIPDIYNLWEVAVNQPSCQLKWNIIGMCRPLLDGSRTQAQREEFRLRWGDANEALARIAADFPENVHFDPTVAQTQFDWSHVSPIDCFHPSIAGQNVMAEKTWYSGH